MLAMRLVDPNRFTCFSLLTEEGIKLEKLRKPQGWETWSLWIEMINFQQYTVILHELQLNFEGFFSFQS